VRGRFAPGSLRGRVALVATATVAAVLLLVGLATLASFAGRERANIDQALQQRPVDELFRAVGPPGAAPGRVPGPGPPVLRARGEYVRLIADGRVVRGIDVPAGVAIPAEPGFRTLSVDGSRYRSLTREAAPGVLVETGTDLTESDARIAELRNRLLLVGLVGILLVAALSWWLAGLVLAPLGRLRDQAGAVGSTDDLSRRIDAGTSTVEIEDLTAGINAMLARLESSADQTRRALDATRRFAGDAGHELRTPMTSIRANLGTIRRNPELDPEEMSAALEQIDREAGRMMRMLGTLQALARGDSSESIPAEAVNLSDLLGAAVEDARRRHPVVAWKLELPEDDLEVTGWPDGLRALVDNLIENAAAHGRTGGRVQIASGVEGDVVKLTVDDDGPGVAPDRREAVFERFERGDATTAEGSGLGLALVRQQARLHGGEVSIADSPLGGARFEVSLAAGTRPTRVTG
jgi:signal transduction histidine kinase